jgi:hypothetical protein
VRHGEATAFWAVRAASNELMVPLFETSPAIRWFVRERHDTDAAFEISRHRPT